MLGIWPFGEPFFPVSLMMVPLEEVADEHAHAQADYCVQCNLLQASQEMLQIGIELVGDDVVKCQAKGNEILGSFFRKALP